MPVLKKLKDWVCSHHTGRLTRLHINPLPKKNVSALNQTNTSLKPFFSSFFDQTENWCYEMINVLVVLLKVKMDLKTFWKFPLPTPIHLPPTHPLPSLPPHAHPKLTFNTLLPHLLNCSLPFKDAESTFAVKAAQTASVQDSHTPKQSSSAYCWF